MTSVLRVLIADLPELQTDVLAALVGGEPGMVVVGRDISPDSLERSIVRLAPDVVVVSRPLRDRDARVLSSLTDLPEVGVIALDASSGTIARVALVPDRREWTTRVIETIRTAGPRHDARHRLPTDPAT